MTRLESKRSPESGVETISSTPAAKSPDPFETSLSDAVDEIRSRDEWKAAGRTRVMHERVINDAMLPDEEQVRMLNEREPQAGGRRLEARGSRLSGGLFEVRLGVL